MRKKGRQLWRMMAAARQQGVSMQRRLILYWVCMLLAVFGALLLALSLAGVFSNEEQKLVKTLEVQQQNTVASLSAHMNGLAAQAVALSEAAGQTLQDVLLEHGAVFGDLNDDPALITALEDGLYAPVHSTLYAGDCSGVFVLLDATVNTGAAQAAHSRMGLYLRYSDLNSTSSANQHLIYFRGVSQVARERQIQMHNRWNLEFDTRQIPGYDDLLRRPVSRLAGSTVWSERVDLKDTWEDALLLCVPVLGGGGRVRGIAGIELSELYFRLSYPAISSSYGSMVTIVAPLENGTLLLDRAMLGGTTGTKLAPKGALTVREGTAYHTYSAEGEDYVGLHRILKVRSASGAPLAAATLLPRSCYEQVADAVRLAWIGGSLVFLLCVLAAALSLSHQFVKPITRSLKAMREEPSGKQPSGISEIDELMEFLHSRAAGAALGEGTLPPNIEELLQTFRKNVETLTPAERRLLQHYVNGHTLKEVPQLAFISVSTAKTHNTNLNRKLGITSRDELMLYIDLFRRCGRLEEIEYNPN